MKKLFFALMAIPLLFVSCVEPVEETKTKDVFTTLRFVASEDFQDFYDITLTYSVPGANGLRQQIVCQSELDDSYKMANVNAAKKILKGCTVDLHPVSVDLNQENLSFEIQYSLSFTRKPGAVVDTTAKYDLAFGRDVVTYDLNKMVSSVATINAFEGTVGTRAEHLLNYLAEIWTDDYSLLIQL